MKELKDYKSLDDYYLMYQDYKLYGYIFNTNKIKIKLMKGSVNFNYIPDSYIHEIHNKFENNANYKNMKEFEKLGIDYFFKHEMSSQTFRKINQSNNIKIVTINDGWICNAIPEYYIHKIQECFNHKITLDITL